MTSETSGTPKIIVQYEWILENVEEEPKTYVSKMILFRGEKVFRVSLKNRVRSPVLFFMAIDLNKIGMKVEGVMYGIQDNGNSPATMWQMEEQWSPGDDGSLQILTIDLTSKVIGNCTFVFRICIEGILPGYSYRLSDRLAKDQLWAATTVTSQHFVDVEFLVKDKKFSAHKSILAARSPVLAAEFTKKQAGKDGLIQIRIDDVKPSTMEQFLYFVYTGEIMGKLANEEVLKLAEKYQLTTLTSLCQLAMKNSKPMQMMYFVNNVVKETEIPPFKIMPEKETEIFFDGTTTTFRCHWTNNVSTNILPESVMQYQNEDIFFVSLTGLRAISPYHISQSVFHCSCTKHRSFGLKVEDIYFTKSTDCNDVWFKMESNHFQKNEGLLHFISQPNSDDFPNGSLVCFYIKIVSTIGNYYYEMMDDAWMKDFWFAATNQKFTDVEIFVGTVKLMEAHRVILSARSPVMKKALVNITNIGRTIFTFDAEFDVDIVKNFLKFLYTGLLETSANNKQLLKLATMYEVETLKNICQLANVPDVPDVEQFTDFLFGILACL